MNPLHRFSRHSLAACLLLAGVLTGQSTSFGGLLVGNTEPTGPAISLLGRVYTQDIATCSRSISRGNGLPMARAGAGGTAYDAVRQAVWISDGVNIALKPLGPGAVSCQFAATLTGGTGNFVTGLAHCNHRRELIQLETFPTTAGSSLALRFYDTSQCPPVALATTCAFPIPRGNVPGVAQALAYDEARDLLFFSTSLTGFAGFSSSIHHVPYPVACLAPSTTFPLPSFGPCGGMTTNAVTGLAYDACARILFVTEGTVTMRLDISNLAAPVNLNATSPCCMFGVAREAWAGLAFVPESTEVAVGTSCLGGGCPSCSSMQLDIDGDLVLGNPGLALVLGNGPGGGAAGLYLSIGACTSPGIQLPGLCGSIHTPFAPLPPFFAGAFPLSGTAACAGSLRLALAVPRDPGLCGIDFCAQCVVTCPGAQGAGLTNAVHFKVGS